MHEIRSVEWPGSLHKVCTYRHLLADFASMGHQACFSAFSPPLKVFIVFRIRRVSRSIRVDDST
jgi:hypothetical protein